MQILTAFALLIPAFSLLYTPQPLALQLRSQSQVKWKTMWKYADNQDVGSEAATHLKSA